MRGAPAGAGLSGGEAAVLALGAAAGSLVFGVSGFAFALTASTIWLQFLPPAEVVPLAVICPLVLNVFTLPRIRADVSLRTLLPFALGSTLGVPLGVLFVAQSEPNALRLAIALLLIGYSAFALSRPLLPTVRLSPAAGNAADGAVGLVGGVLGGVAGLSVVLPSLWIGARGFPKGIARGLLQSFGFYSQALTLLVFASVVGLGADTLRALAVCLPVAVAGSLVGFALFRRMSGEAFRRAVLWIVLCGGVGLLLRVLR